MSARPRLTDRVLRGIIEGCTRSLVEIEGCVDDPDPAGREARAEYREVEHALKWAHRMIRHREQEKRPT